MFKHYGNTETSNKVTVLKKALQKVFEKFKNVPFKTSMVVYFDLTLANKKLNHRRLLLGLSGKAVVQIFCSTDAVLQNYQNGLFLFLSIQGYGQTNFQKPVRPGKNDCLTHKSLGIECQMIRSLELRKKNYTWKTFSVSNHEKVNPGN